MSNCERIQDFFVDALYGDLPAAERQLLDAHLKECPACAGEFTGMKSTLDVMSRRERPELGSEYWQSFDAKLQERIAGSQPARIILFRRVPTWAWQVAAALVLVGLGVVMGRMNTPVTKPSTGIAKVTTAPAVQVVSAEQETKRFLERSEVLLLGVMNAEPAAGETTLDLSHQKMVSRELIQEASLIKGKLENPRQRRLRELVSDLQLILLQIATMETSQDQPEIEILKSGVDRKGLLLKIDLEQMRQSQPKVVKPAASPKKAEPAI